MDTRASNDWQARVTALVVTVNSAHCMPALGSGLRDMRHVIVIDNASDDDTLHQTGLHLPQARVLAQATNLGFGAANNLGWRAADTEFIFLINPDCVCSSAAIAQLVRTADAHPNASVVAPQLLDRRGQPDTSYRWRADNWVSRGQGAQGICSVGFVCGAAMLIRRAAMQQVDGFDESFFLYYEDEDLCLRLQDRFGPILVDPDAQMQHLSRSSVAGQRRMHYEFIRGFHHIQSKFLCGRKHFGREVGSMRRWIYGLSAIAETLVRLLLLDLRRGSRCAGKVAGVVGYRSQPMPPPAGIGKSRS